MEIWDLVYKIARGIFVVLIAVGLLLLFRPRWQQHHELQKKKIELEEDVRLKREMIQLLRYKQEQFSNDARFVENMAHEMGMAKPGEMIFKFAEDQQ